MTLHIVYTDPWWSVDDTGRQDRSRARIEREIYGLDYRLILGDYRAGRFKIDEDSIVAMTPDDTCALVVYRARITRSLLRRLPASCTIVARQGVGIDNLDLSAMREAGIRAFHVPNYCVDETSTHAAALILDAARGVTLQDRLSANGDWNSRMGGTPGRTSLQTLGIVGFGRIGRALARKMSSFFKTLLVYDPYVHEDEIEGLGCRKSTSLEYLLAESDAVSLHCTLTEETVDLINSESLAQFRRGAILVNTARGRLVTSGAVLEALQASHLGVYASDVWSPENPNDDAASRELAFHPRTIRTCHRGFLSDKSDESLRARVAEEVLNLLSPNGRRGDGRLT